MHRLIDNLHTCENKHKGLATDARPRISENLACQHSISNHTTDPILQAMGNLRSPLEIFTPGFLAKLSSLTSYFASALYLGQLLSMNPVLFPDTKCV